MLWALAIDHRRSFRTQFLGESGPLSPWQEAQVRRVKRLALEALLVASEQGLPGGRAAFLVDEEYGAELVRPAREAGVTVIVPVEKSGRDELAFEHGDDGFGAAIERVAPSYVKVLVRYNPANDPEVNARQRKRLSRLQAWLDANGRDWMLELLVPPGIGERSTSGFDRARWDVATRPSSTVEAIDELVASGVRPAFWKLEGMPSTAAYEAVARATYGSGRPDGACLVLGRGADAAAVDRWLEMAAPLPTYRGFAVGRTLWWEPLKEVLTGTCTDSVAVDRIAANYLRLIDVYMSSLSA